MELLSFDLIIEASINHFFFANLFIQYFKILKFLKHLLN